MAQRLQSICPLISYAWLTVRKNGKSARRGQADTMIWLHQHHPSTLRRHELRLLLENGQCLLLHVGRRFGQTIYVFDTALAEFYCVRRIHAMMALAHCI